MAWEKLVEREGDFFKNVLLYESLEEHFPRLLKRHHPPFLTVRQGDVFIHYQEEESKKEFGLFLEQQGAEFIERVIANGKEHFQQLLFFCQNLPPLQKCSDEELAGLLQSYCSLYKKPYPHFNISPFADYMSDDSVVRALAEWRFWARDSFNKAHGLSDPLFQEIATRLHLTVKELKFLKPQEIVEGLLRHHTIQCRQQCYFHFQDGSFVLKENAFPEFLEEAVEVTEKTTMVYGQGTFPATYSGRIRVITTTQDLKDVEEGEVLVLRMTTPDLMLEWIKKAGAIITDEGGITCHAAVLSREFKIPTLTGTTKATRVFRTGDYVRVDTGAGMAYQTQSSKVNPKEE